MEQQQALIQLQDPNLPPEQLAYIADTFPKLRVQVVTHPSMYPGLWHWLGSLCDPQVIAAMDAVAEATPDPGTFEPPSAPHIVPTAAPSENAKDASRRRWLVPLITCIMVVALVAGVSIWWFTQGGGYGGELTAKVGTEEAVAAGKKVAARLADNDETIAARQAVAGPGLFYYAFDDEDISETDEGEPFISNEVIIEVTSDEGGRARTKTGLETAEAVAAELDARVVGVDNYLGSYQLLLNANLSSEELLAVIDKATAFDTAVEATANVLNPMTLSSDAPSSSPTGRDRDDEDGSEWSGKWGSRLGSWDDEAKRGGNWGMQALGAPAIWDAETELQLTPVTVGVFDGFYEGQQHADLPKPKASFVSPVRLTETNKEDDNLAETSHGLHVSGTIAAGAQNPPGVRGVAPNVELVVASPSFVWHTDPWHEFRYKWGLFVDRYSTSSCLTFLGAHNPRVINISVGESDEDNPGPHALDKKGLFASYRGNSFVKPLLAIIEGADGREMDTPSDILIVKAAGNDACEKSRVDDGGDICAEAGAPDVSDPKAGELKARAQNHEALASRLITVGAAGPVTAEKGFAVAGQSNAGADVLAPGLGIRSTVDRVQDAAMSGSPAGSLLTDGYGNMSGTSMAAPHVTGLAAVLYGINPNLTAVQVKQIIEATANNDPNLYWNETGKKNPPTDSLKHPVPLVNGAAAVEVALLSKPSDGSNGVASSFDTLLEQIKSGGVAAGTQSVPAQLLGTWCPADQLDSTASPTKCFNLETYFANNPQGSITAVSSVNGSAVLTPLDPYARGTTRSDFNVCSTGACKEGDGLYNLTYYPPGAQWECLGEAPTDTCPAQAESIAQNHDISYPRIVQTYRAETGDMVQSEPYLLNLRVPVASWNDYLTLPFVESAPLEMNLTQIAKGDFSSIVGHWIPDDSGTLCADFQDNSNFSVGKCGADMEVRGSMSGTGLIPDPTRSEFPFNEPAQVIPVSNTQLQLVWTRYNYGTSGRPAIYVMHFERANGLVEERLSGTTMACMTGNCGGAMGDGGKWLHPFSDDVVTWLYRE